MARVVSGRDQEQRRAERRNAILDAALDLFSTYGYLASPIERLCQHAHVSTKSFYEAFDSREACYLALMQRSTDHLKETVVAAMPADLGDEVAVADHLLLTFAHAMADDPRHAVVLFGHGSATTPDVERVRRTNRRWTAAFLNDVWQAMPNRVGSSAGVITGLVGGLFDIVADWVVDDEPDAHGTDRAAVLGARLHNFYWVVRNGALLMLGDETQS